MKLSELEQEITNIFYIFGIKFKKDQVVKGITVQFICDTFGVIVSCIDSMDYVLIKNNINEKYPGYREIYVTEESLIHEVKEDIMWAFIRGGYIRHIRNKYKGQFNYLISQQNFDKKIIDKRLSIWGNKPKYKWWVEENKAALNQNTTYILSVDPAFFDYVPEEE